MLPIISIITMFLLTSHYHSPREHISTPQFNNHHHVSRPTAIRLNEYPLRKVVVCHNKETKEVERQERKLVNDYKMKKSPIAGAGEFTRKHWTIESLSVYVETRR